MTEPNYDRTGVEILTPDKCRQLLASSSIGRIGLLADGDVLVLPVTYGVADEHIVFRTGIGSKLEAAMFFRPVAFEIDSWNAATRTGWSVLVKGMADEVTNDREVAELEDLGVVPWAAPDLRERWVRIRIDEISGRRIGEHPTTPPT